jgi:hypothetical protein
MTIPRIASSEPTREEFGIESRMVLDGAWRGIAIDER